MATKMWEVDPETRSKLQEISKTNENNKCVDCGAPSPQWASPKFGIFFCLSCSGIHRSLGVHISFVRSVTMDAFKMAEVKRMQLGGNKPWRDFFNAHSSNTLSGRDFESCTIAERYDSEAGEEWKERLTAKVEGVDYIPGATKKIEKTRPATTGITPAGSGRSTPVPTSVPGSTIKSPPPQRTASPSQKTRNEAYFATKGAENASRPDNLAPSQGGKYAGFGSAPPPSSTDSNPTNTALPSTNDFQQDPVAALTKGFGWLSSNLTKQAANVNKAYIQPGLQSLSEGDFAAQAKATALSAGTYVQQGAKGVGDQFNKFVDPDAASSPPRAGGGVRGRGVQPEKADFWDSFGQAPAGPPKEKKDFWDDFAAAGESRAGGVAAQAKPTSVGTSAMKKGGAGGSGGGKKEDGEWGDW